MSPITITKTNFESEVKSFKGEVLLDFWASWCGPCRMLSPVIDEIAEETPALKVGKVNVDEEPELAAAFGVQSIPTVVIIKDGEIKEKSVGYKPKDEIIELL
ncbi:MAG: thioredoxin [Candidatus Flemingibacterium sp.]|nr:thioredoxin [Candidatus Flemingibacterium sp.]